jgi:hypothetical protein
MPRLRCSPHRPLTRDASQEWLISAVRHIYARARQARRLRSSRRSSTTKRPAGGPRYPLAHVGLARAAARAGHRARARKTYEDFLDLWKGADADMPILIEARKE